MSTLKRNSAGVVDAIGQYSYTYEGKQHRPRVEPHRKFKSFRASGYAVGGQDDATHVADPAEYEEEEYSQEDGAEPQGAEGLEAEADRVFSTLRRKPSTTRKRSKLSPRQCSRGEIISFL